MDMTRTTLGVGVLLVLLGVGTYVGTGFDSWTALIPALAGLLLLACWGLARTPGRHGLGLHLAMVVALLGALGTLMNVVQLPDAISGDAERPAAVWESVVMFVVLVAYLVLGVRSFVAARRDRERAA